MATHFCPSCPCPMCGRGPYYYPYPAIPWWGVIPPHHPYPPYPPGQVWCASGLEKVAPTKAGE